MKNIPRDFTKIFLIRAEIGICVQNVQMHLIKIFQRKKLRKTSKKIRNTKYKKTLLQDRCADIILNSE